MCNYYFGSNGLPNEGTTDRQAFHSGPNTPSSTLYNWQTSCGTKDISQLKDVAANIKGNTDQASCPNDMLASSKGSNWNMGHTMSGPSEQGWYSYTCQNWRSSSDNAQKVKPITHGNVIKFRAGYNFFETASAKQSESGSPAQLM